jgi:hypothetical protein
MLWGERLRGRSSISEAGSARCEIPLYGPRVDAVWKGLSGGLATPTVTLPG